MCNLHGSSCQIFEDHEKALFFQFHGDCDNATPIAWQNYFHYYVTFTKLLALEHFELYTAIFCLHVAKLFTVLQLFLYPCNVQSAMNDLTGEIQEQSKSSTQSLTLLPTASEMVTVMETIEQLLQ